MTTFPIFSVAAALAHDFVQTNERVKLSAALMFYYALGEITSPSLASFLINHFGTSPLFALIAFSHVFLIIFRLSRMRERPTRIGHTRYIYLPCTSFIIGRLLKRMRDKR